MMEPCQLYRWLRTGLSTAVLFIWASAVRAVPEVSYEDQVYSYRNGSIEARLWVPYPPGGQVVRGVFQRGNAGTGNFMMWTDNGQFRRYAALQGFGMCSTRGISGSRTYEKYGMMMLEAYEMWAALGHHPELANVPFVVFGNSSSGAFTYGFTSLVPERVICFAANVPAGLNPADPLPAAMQVPGIFIAGEKDEMTGSLAKNIEPLMKKARSQGALWSKMEIEGMGHEHRRTLHLFYPFFEKCLALRYPADADPRKGPVELRPIDESAGWIADDTTWGTGLTAVMPVTQAADPRGADTSWLLDEEMAFLHRAYSSRNNRVVIRTEDELPWGAYAANSDTVERTPGGKAVLFGEVSGVPGWDRIELYHGAEKVDEYRGGGDRFWFEVDIPEGPRLNHPYSVLVCRGASIFPSHMFTILALPEETAKKEQE